MGASDGLSIMLGQTTQISTMKTRQLGPFQVSAIGLGCMNLSHAYGAPVSREQGERVLLAALDAGVTFFDTAALYGFGANETLVGEVLKPHRNKFTLASKCGMQGVDKGDGTKVRVIDGRPDTLRQTCEDALRRLQTDVIDLYYLHRWDKKVPIEDSVGALSDLVRAGKIRTIGLSEVSASTLRKAHAVHPITAVQTEYSLWTRNPEIAVLAACRELGVGFVPFSPVARGFLCGPLDIASFDAKDIRRTMPRFAPDHYAANLKLLPAYTALAQEAGCSPSQLALAWLLHKGDDLIPIPGTTSVTHLMDDLGAVDVKLSADLIERVEDLINERTVVGDRYNAQANSEVDTETFA
jgi:aryl-alcohol dehydrogenase-like predicted oxidoreductase